MAKIRPTTSNESTKQHQTKPVDMFDLYEKEIVKKRHNCTDIICLILFLVFVVVQIALSVIIYVVGGDPQSLLMPYDSNGDMCTGSTPNLFYFNLVECANVNAFITGCTSPSVCVSSCPKSNYYYVIDSHRSIIYSQFCSKTALATYYGSASAIPSSTPDVTTFTNLIRAKACPAYTLQETSVYGRCIPSYAVATANGVADVTAKDPNNGTSYTMNDLNGPLSPEALKAGIQYIYKLLNVKGIAQFIFEDFVNGVYLIALLIVIAAVTSFAYIMILRWILKPLFYISLVGLIGVLAFGIYFCFDKYLTLKDNANQSFQFSSDVSNYGSLSITWLVAGCIGSVILLLLIVLMIFLLKRIRLAIQLICEASKAITSIFLTLLFPIVPLLLQVGFLAYFLANAVILACSGKKIFKVANATNASVNVGDSCNSAGTSGGVQCVFYKYGFDQQSTYSSVIGFLSEHQYVPQLYNIFMLFWVQAFIVGWSQMVLAGCFGIWYWSKSKSSCILFTSIKDTCVYHLGSIAFGSLLIAICKFLRMIIEMVERRLKKATGNNAKINCIITFLGCCCKCCLWCLEKFLKFINRNAYIMVAIYGRNFCSSARDALKLLLSNPLRALILDRVTDFVLLIGRLLITSAVGVLGFYFFSKSFTIDPAFKKYLAPDLHYYWVPLVAVIIAAYFISKTFLTVFEMAVDTVFLCAMKDLDIHDGSAEKPYFMSTKMLKILSVKNKFQIEGLKNDDDNKEKDDKKSTEDRKY